MEERDDKMKKIAFFLLIGFVLPSFSYAQEIQEIEQKKIYKANADFPHIVEIGDPSKKLVLRRKSRIRIIKIEDSQDFKDRIYYFRPEKNYDEDFIVKDKIYSFLKSDKPELYLENWQSIIHGTLVVPFKVRTRDGRLMGDATIGYYVGTRRNLFFSDLDITPLISFGLSTITVPQDENDTQTKAGITGAIGVILNHTGNFQIGIVSGIDHLGGSEGDNWKYEDDVWVSFMVGYNFAQ